MGLVYQINFKALHDDKEGRIEIEFSSSASDVKKILLIIKNELREISENGLTKPEFEKGINSKKRELARLEEPTYLLNKLSYDQMIYGRIRSKKEIEKNACNVDNENIKELAKYILKNKSFVILAVGDNIKKSDLRVFEK